MTGADVKRQVCRRLDPWCDETLTQLARVRLIDALAPCIVLTAEEAAQIYDALIETPGLRSPTWIEARALLTPDQVPQ